MHVAATGADEVAPGPVEVYIHIYIHIYIFMTITRSYLSLILMHVAATGADEVAPGPVEGGTVVSKFHFVDLAGSERAKRTGAEGDRYVRMCAYIYTFTHQYMHVYVHSCIHAGVYKYVVLCDHTSRCMQHQLQFAHPR